MTLLDIASGLIHAIVQKQMNSSIAGLPIPEFLRDALKQLNERKAAPPG